jgi:hypothetical protein
MSSTAADLRHTGRASFHCLVEDTAAVTGP